MSSQWVLVQPSTALTALVGLPETALPVRHARVDAIFKSQTSRIELCDLVDELEVFAGEEPDAIARLTPSMALLARAAIGELLWENQWERAETYARLARRWSPNDTPLLVQLGRALHGLGRHSEATTQWQSAIARAREAEQWSPMLWLLTARSLMEQDQFDEAALLVDEISVRCADDAVESLRLALDQKRTR